MIREHRRPREGAAAPAPADDRLSATPSDAVPAAPGLAGPAAAATPAQLPSIPLAGLTRRRLAWILAAAVAVWILFTFARQVSEAADATARAERARAANATLIDQLERLRAELAFIQQPEFVALQARAYGVGGRGERQFTLSAGAPTLPPDAPGSATQRVGYRVETRTPLDAWITLLFDPGSGG
jgi:hypothetical protein